MTRRRRWSKIREAGYSMAEVALVLAIIGILTTLATPLFLTYYQASRLRVGAEEVAAFINQGRQLGIRENAGVCVHITSTALQYRLGSSCAGAAWLGPGTDAAGNVKVPEGVTLSTTADPIFSYLGAAAPAATITVTNAQTGRILRVSVAASGRVSIGP
jgi:prepilin-type N-terminal cleavage/methylation domain-containing protein